MIEDNLSPCPGCQRLEMHAHCPARGTPFYMSSVPYTEKAEEAYTFWVEKGLTLNAEQCFRNYRAWHRELR